jgi:hypothetical protein
MRRWKKPPPATPQLGLGLRHKGATDTSRAAAESVGAILKNSGAGVPARDSDSAFTRGVNMADLTGAMMGALRKQNERQSLRTFALAKKVRDEILDQLRELGDRGATADELAVMLKRSNFTTRPRCTELGNFGQIRDSGRRRRNVSGRNAIVWVIG